MPGNAPSTFLLAMLAESGVIALAAGALAFAWWRRSIFVAAFACVVILLAGGWFEPWLTFLPGLEDDPVAAQGLTGHRILAALWLLEILGGPGCLLALIQLRRL